MNFGGAELCQRIFFFSACQFPGKVEDAKAGL
jgi:hypothetical protein